ncbi:MAG: J domain-containing protein [Actinomycetota bacterium]|nr:J domain-containing protein [Actinomycetota bacterium]
MLQFHDPGAGAMSSSGRAMIEFFHSKSFSPTRRLSLGEVRLSGKTGSLLVSQVAARFGVEADRTAVEEVRDLCSVLRQRGRASQPRGRYRLQTDRIGLTPARDVLLTFGGRSRFLVIDRDVNPVTHLLAALYASAGRPRLLDAFQEGFEHPELRNGVDLLRDAGSPNTHATALRLFGFGAEGAPSFEVRRRYRQLLREAHPDNGGNPEEAASRISELQRALSLILAGTD